MNEMPDTLRYIDISKYDFRSIMGLDRRNMERVLIEFGKRMGVPTHDEAEALMEQFNILKSRGLPAKDWLINVIYEISKKEPQKRTIQYIIGLIRNRMTNGWGTSRSTEEQLIINSIEEKLGPISIEGKTAIYEMMGVYGATRIALLLNLVSTEKSFLDALKNQLEGHT